MMRPFSPRLPLSMGVGLFLFLFLPLVAQAQGKCDQKKLIDQCACIKEWADALHKWHPNVRIFNTQQVAMLFQDGIFNTYFGSKYLDLDLESREKIYDRMLKCQEKYPDQFAWEKKVLNGFNSNTSLNSVYSYLQQKHQQEDQLRKAYELELARLQNFHVTKQSFEELDARSRKGYQEWKDVVSTTKLNELEQLLEDRLFEARKLLFAEESKVFQQYSNDYEKIDRVSTYNAGFLFRAPDYQKAYFQNQLDSFLQVILAEVVRKQKKEIDSWATDFSYLNYSNAWSDSFRKFYIDRYGNRYKAFADLYDYFLEQRKRNLTRLFPEFSDRIKQTQEDEALKQLQQQLTYIQAPVLEDFNRQVESAIASRRNELITDASADYTPDQTWFSSFLEAAPLTRERTLGGIKKLALEFDRKGERFSSPAVIKKDSLACVKACLQLGFEIDPESPYKLVFYAKTTLATFTSEKGIEKTEQDLLSETIETALKVPATIYRNGVMVDTEVILASNIKAAIYNIDARQGSFLSFDEVLVDLLSNFKPGPRYPFPEKELHRILFSPEKAAQVANGYELIKASYREKDPALAGLSDVFAGVNREITDGESFAFTLFFKPNERKLTESLRKSGLSILTQAYKQHLLPGIYQEISEVATPVYAVDPYGTNFVYGMMSNFYVEEPNCFVNLNGAWYHTAARVFEMKSVAFDIEDMPGALLKMTNDASFKLVRSVRESLDQRTVRSPFELEFIPLRLYKDIILDRFELPQIRGYSVDQVIQAYEKSNRANAEWNDSHLLYFKDEAGELFVAGVDQTTSTFEVHPLPFAEIKRFMDSSNLPYLEKYEILKRQHPAFDFIVENDPLPKWDIITRRVQAATVLSAY